MHLLNADGSFSELSGNGLRCLAALALVATAATVAAQPSLLVPVSQIQAVARWLRDAPDLRLDFCSNVTGVDWPDRDEKVKVKKTVDALEKHCEKVVVLGSFTMSELIE